MTERRPVVYTVVGVCQVCGEETLGDPVADRWRHRPRKQVARPESTTGDRCDHAAAGPALRPPSRHRC